MLVASVEIGEHITNCTLGGPQLSTLYVTSATDGLSPSDPADRPLAGAVFAVDVDAHGLPASEFRT